MVLNPLLSSYLLKALEVFRTLLNTMYAKRKDSAEAMQCAIIHSEKVSIKKALSNWSLKSHVDHI